MKNPRTDHASLGRCADLAIRKGKTDAGRPGFPTRGRCRIDARTLTTPFTTQRLPKRSRESDAGAPCRLVALESRSPPRPRMTNSRTSLLAGVLLALAGCADHSCPVCDGMCKGRAHAENRLIIGSYDRPDDAERALGTKGESGSVSFLCASTKFYRAGGETQLYVRVLHVPAPVWHFAVAQLKPGETNDPVAVGTGLVGAFSSGSARLPDAYYHAEHAELIIIGPDWDVTTFMRGYTNLMPSILRELPWRKHCGRSELRRRPNVGATSAPEGRLPSSSTLGAVLGEA